jgi:hypothetical protein
VIILTDKGKQIKGDMIVSAILRNDMSPIPVTFEAEIRTDADMEAVLREGSVLTVGADTVRIVKSERHIQGTVQGERLQAVRRITALLDACHKIAFIRPRAIIKENATLSGVYRAAGATLREIEADYSVPRFTCFTGDSPAWHIARAIQEAGGVVRWKNGKLKFMRLLDLSKQKAVLTLTNNATDDVESGFLERHEIPTFFSIDKAAAFVAGNVSKERPVRFAPHADAMQLHSMTRCLVRKKTQKISFNGQLSAGDAVQYSGMAKPMTIITVAHVWESGTDGSGANQYSRLWAGEVEE